MASEWSTYQKHLNGRIGFGFPTDVNLAIKRLRSTQKDYMVAIESVGDDLEPFISPFVSCKFAVKQNYEHYLATADDIGIVRLHDTNNIRDCPIRLGRHSNAVFDLAWRPGAMQFVTVSGDQSWILWDCDRLDAAMGTYVGVGTKSTVKTVSFCPVNTNVFATGGRDGTISFWDLRTPGMSGILGQSSRRLLFGDMAVLLSYDNIRNISLVRLKNGTVKKRPKTSKSVTALVHVDDNTLVSATEGNGELHFWDLRKTYNHKKRPTPKCIIGSLNGNDGHSNLIVDGGKLYATSLKNVIYCFNTSAPAQPLHMKYYCPVGSSSYYMKTSLSPDGRYLITGSTERYASIFDVKHSTPIAQLYAERGMHMVDWSGKKGLPLIVTAGDAGVRVWRSVLNFTENRDDEANATRLRLRHAIDDDEIDFIDWYGDREEISSHDGVVRIGQTGGELCAWEMCFCPECCNKKFVEKREMTRLSTKDESSKDMTSVPNEMKSRKRKASDYSPSTNVKRAKLSENELNNSYDNCQEIRHQPIGREQCQNCRLYSINRKRSIERINENVDTFVNEILTPKTTPLRPNQDENKLPNHVNIDHPGLTTPTKSNNSPMGQTCDFRSVSFPNFALHGQAPHLSIISPMKPRTPKSNWLRDLTLERNNMDELRDPCGLVSESPRTIKTPSRSRKDDRALRTPRTPNTPKAPVQSPLLKYFRTTGSGKSGAICSSSDSVMADEDGVKRLESVKEEN